MAVSRGASILAVLLLLAVALTAHAGAPPTVHVCPAGCTFGVLQDAVDAAPAGSAILVAPGTYQGPITIDKPLVLRGAHAGVAVAERTGPASVIEASASEEAGVRILAGGVTLDGFTLRNPAALAGKRGIDVAPAAGTVNLLRNLVEGHGVGAAVQGTAPRLLEGNHFTANNDPGDLTGLGVWAKAPTSGLVLRANAFRGHAEAAVAVVPGGAPSALHRDLRIEGNRIDEGAGLVLTRARDAVLDGNSITKATGAGLVVGGDVAGLDLVLNRFHDGASTGVRVTRLPGIDEPNKDLVLAFNSLERNVKAALDVEPGSHAGAVEAARNWWASPTGPVADPTGSLSDRPATRYIQTVKGAAGQTRLAPWCPNPPCGPDVVCWEVDASGAFQTVGIVRIETENTWRAKTTCGFLVA